MQYYSLETILDTIATSDGAKRIVLNSRPLGGVGSMATKVFFILLPFIEFAAIFNPVVFNALGIAQSIVVYIVFLSIVMIIVFLITLQTKRSVMKAIEPSWKHYFESIDLAMILSSGATPYSQFFDYYARILKDGKRGEELYASLQQAFLKMSEENSELIDVIARDKNRR